MNAKCTTLHSCSAVFAGPTHFAEVQHVIVSGVSYPHTANLTFKFQRNKANNLNLCIVTNCNVLLICRMHQKMSTFTEHTNNTLLVQTLKKQTENQHAKTQPVMN